MNRATIIDGKLNLELVDDKIKIDYITNNDEFMVDTLKIIVTDNTRLELNFEGDNFNKLDVFITVLENAIFDYFEVKSSGEYKMRYKYFIEENATVNVTKVYDVKKIKELNMIYLNGYKAEINYLHKTISKSEEVIEVVVHHKYDRTISNIKNQGVNILDGVLNFNVTSIIPINTKKCVAHQFTRIVNLTKNKCNITPNLLIEGNTSLAEHAAYIGSFKDDELFYIESRGIDKKDAIKLLIKGFMLDGINAPSLKTELIEKIIEKYGM